MTKEVILLMNNKTIIFCPDDVFLRAFWFVDVLYRY